MTLRIELLASAAAAGQQSRRRLASLREVSLRQQSHKQYSAPTRGWGR